MTARNRQRPARGALRGVGSRSPTPRRRFAFRGSGRSGRAVVDVDEATVVRRHLLGCRIAVEALRVGGVRLHGLAEDRAPDRKADVPLDAGAGAQPLVDLRVGRAAPEHDARDAVAPFAANELCDLATRLAIVDALDLPDVGLDARVLQLEDDLHHQLGAKLDVVTVLAPVDARELRLLRRHEQLEQELAVPFVQPLGERQQARRLALVHRLVALGVVADEHLREVRVELLDLVAEGLAVLELKLVLPGLLDRHRELVAARLRRARDVRAVLRVDEDAGVLLRRALLDRTLESLPDQGLRAGHQRGIADHLLERTAMVEREDVDPLVVPELLQADAHRNSLPVNVVSFCKLWRASMRRTVP